MKLGYKIRLWLLYNCHGNSLLVAKDIIYYDEFNLMKYFISINADFHHYIIPMIRYSIYYGSAKMTKFLLNLCSNDEITKRTIDGCIIEEVYVSGHQEYINYIQSRNIIIPDQVLFHMLSKMGCCMSVSMFKPVPYLLHKACMDGNISLAQTCLKHGYNVNEPWDGDDYTPLYYVINGCNPNLTLLKILISAGAVVHDLDVHRAKCRKLDQSFMDVLQNV